MKKIILASGSPRRKEILTSMGVEFDVVKSDIDEKSSDGTKPNILAMALAFEKANSVAINNVNDFVLGADTIVAIDGIVLGKPRDKDEATKFLKLLSGRTHEVITGFSIICLNEKIKIIDCEVSEVKFKKLSDIEIDEYVNDDEPYDKAGGYAIQGKASKFIESYHGDYDNIVGIPKDKLKKYLLNFGVL